MPLRARRSLVPLILSVAFAAIAVASASAAASSPSAASALASGGNAPRHGGHVRRAWPAKKAHRPKTAIARWLARQVGPSKPVACPQQRTKANGRCATPHRKGRASASSTSASRAATCS